MSAWSTAAELTTGAGTLVLALATFASVRSANRAARVAERSLLAGLRPVLVPSRLEDPPEKFSFGDSHWMKIGGGHAVIEATPEAVYLGMALRNAGTGLAVLHGWVLNPEPRTGDAPHADLSEFRLLQRDLWIPGGGLGFWQGAFRDPTDPAFAAAAAAADEHRRVTVEILYGDHEGGQRAISRFGLFPAPDGTWLAAIARHWNLDRADPR